MVITGKTRLVGLIGYPLEHTLSPFIHNALFKKFGLDVCYVPLPVKPGLLHEAIRGIRAFQFLGANVTMPYKTEILPTLDSLDSQAEISRSVNTVKLEHDLLVGYNTDGTGFCLSVEEQTGTPIEGSRVVILGAGGAARSIAVSLATRGCHSIVVVNRTIEKAEYIKALVEKCSRSTKVLIFSPSDNYADALREANLIINATPLEEIEKGGYAFSFENIAPGTIVCDLKYFKSPSSFLRRAAEYGALTLDGRGMLIHQAALGFRIWTGIDPPIDFMRNVLESAIGSNPE